MLWRTINSSCYGSRIHSDDPLHCLLLYLSAKVIIGSRASGSFVASCLCIRLQGFFPVMQQDYLKISTVSQSLRGRRKLWNNIVDGKDFTWIVNWQHPLKYKNANKIYSNPSIKILKKQFECRKKSQLASTIWKRIIRQTPPSWSTPMPRKCISRRWKCSKRTDRIVSYEI